MKQAIFITGFNNWGKTTIIQELFNRKKYYPGVAYQIGSVNADFTVESHSNDDYGGQNWINAIQRRINQEPRNNVNLITALCPAMENGNRFTDLLSNPLFSAYSTLHLFLIEYKWEHHAKLIVSNIIQEGKAIPNINFITINADRNKVTDQERWDAKFNQIYQELQQIFP